jgi:hypothetical protein
MGHLNDVDPGRDPHDSNRSQNHPLSPPSALTGGVTTATADRLMIKIRAFINGCNNRCHPFIWTTPATEILDKLDRKPTALTGH